MPFLLFFDKYFLLFLCHIKKTSFIAYRKTINDIEKQNNELYKDKGGD